MGGGGGVGSIWGAGKERVGSGIPMVVGTPGEIGKICDTLLLLRAHTACSFTT